MQVVQFPLTRSLCFSYRARVTVNLTLLVPVGFVGFLPFFRINTKATMLP
ncbi:hypothetical protein HNR37_001139 [Desulfurispira natronophila]|uniref:Uncharacterized protein n=1 Tax=Desulfurispira natronophila TaxID=682562 RepID=A0A7W8DGV2_9BACT|nr:hypothetical protein [Desulfurispira natronophila]